MLKVRAKTRTFFAPAGLFCVRGLLCPSALSVPEGLLCAGREQLYAHDFKLAY